MRKLRDADAMLNAGKDLAAVLPALEIGEPTLTRWRQQYAERPQYLRERMCGYRKFITRETVAVNVT